jgi:hypothetical protein
MSALLDAIGQVGYALDTPGAYTRGLLAGRPGERVGGRELLQDWGVLGANTAGLDWGDAAGFAAEAVLDPLSLLGPALGAAKGIGRATAAGRAVAQSDTASPLLRRLGEFVGDEAGHVDLDVARRLVESRRAPLGRLAGMIEGSPANLEMGADYLGGHFGYPGPAPKGGALAHYSPSWTFTNNRGEPLSFNGFVAPNLNVDAWADDAAMKGLFTQGIGSLFGHTAPASIPRSALPSYVGVHEMGHAYHDPLIKAATRLDELDGPMPVESAWDLLPPDAGYRGGGMLGGWQMPESLDRSVTRSLGKYATTNPDEFVAEAFSRKVLGRKPLPRGLDDLYAALRGPDPGQLPPSFWEAIR